MLRNHKVLPQHTISRNAIFSTSQIAGQPGVEINQSDLATITDFEKALAGI